VKVASIHDESLRQPPKCTSRSSECALVTETGSNRAPPPAQERPEMRVAGSLMRYQGPPHLRGLPTQKRTSALPTRLADTRAAPVGLAHLTHTVAAASAAPHRLACRSDWHLTQRALSETLPKRICSLPYTSTVGVGLFESCQRGQPSSRQLTAAMMPSAGKHFEH
jgi:hypothetical protein